MSKVKIKHHNPHSPESKFSLLCILSKHDVYLNRAIQVRDGFLSFRAETQDCDKLFKKTTLDELAAEDFLPSEIKAKRTVFLFGVDSHIMKNSVEAIKEEVQRLNPFTDQNIVSIFKFPNNAPILKITFSETPPAQKCLEAGLKMFKLRISAHIIK